MRGRVVLAAALAVVTIVPPGAGADTLLEQYAADPPTTIATALEALNVELVGHTPLGSGTFSGGRGNNAAPALAGDCVYVGNRGFDREKVLVVDVADPTAPFVTNEIADTGTQGSTTRELRTSPANHLLVVMTYSQTLGSRAGNELRLYDISDCRNPALASVLNLSAIRPHEFFLWEDPLRDGRVIAYVTTPFGPPQIVVADLTDASAPQILTAWEGLYPQPVGAEAENSGLASYVHSLSVSADGRTGHLAYWDAGYVQIDTSQVADALPAPVLVGLTPAQQATGVGSTGYTFREPPDDDTVRLLNRGNTHSAVPLPDRADGRFVALTDEAYDASGECPYGWFHLVDATDPLRPHVASEYKLTQNTVEWCDDPANITAPRDDDYIVNPHSTHDATWSSHNLTLTRNLAVVAWHAGGIQFIDTSDPTDLAQVGSYIPEPIPQQGFRPRPAELQTYLGNHPVLMWSYPIVSDGLVYVVDIRNGLYVLRYTGPHSAELEVPFLEGNSNVAQRVITPGDGAHATATVIDAEIPSHAQMDPKARRLAERLLMPMP